MDFWTDFYNNLISNPAVASIMYYLTIAWNVYCEARNTIKTKKIIELSDIISKQDSKLKEFANEITSLKQSAIQENAELKQMNLALLDVMTTFALNTNVDIDTKTKIATLYGNYKAALVDKKTEDVIENNVEEVAAINDPTDDCLQKIKDKLEAD